MIPLQKSMSSLSHFPRTGSYLLISGDQYLSADSLSDNQKVYVDGLVKKAYENWNQVIEYEGKSLLNFNEPERFDISQNDPAAALANYSTNGAADRPMQVTVPPNQSPVLSEFSTGGYNQTLATAQPHNPQAQFNIILQQDQFMGHQHQTQITIENENVSGLALGPPQSAIDGYQNIKSSVNPLEDWTNERDDDFFSEEEIRLRSHEMLENDDMQQLLQLFSMGGNEEDGFALPSFMHNTPMMQGCEDRGRSGKPVAGWLKIKAAMRWVFFIRRKAAERRAQIVELDDDE